jgi:low affinity Fe/Cu permease
MASASLTTGETRFDRFAETASRFVSQASFFFISLVVVSIWMPTIVLFDDVDTWQLVINTATSVLAFLLLALLQNSERRYDHALHHKVDVLAQALATVMRHQVEADSAAVRRSIDELNAAIGLERKV